MLARMFPRRSCRARRLVPPPGAAMRFAALLLALALHDPAAASEPPVVFAAASTTAALSELAARHERLHGHPVRLSFASSATLARQILHGAQPALFLSANRRWMDALDNAGRLAAGTRRDLLGNRLVVIRPVSAETSLSLADPDSLLGALGEAPLLLADPSHVPAGAYAREALERLELWDLFRGRLAFAASARAVTARVARGEAPLGITYASELKGESRIQAAARIPAQTHSPIRYEIAMIAPGKDPVAAAFLDYLHSDDARSVFLERGFRAPRP
ncbi:molybdate ABC transporter substrate-binding protein [Candidatus Foliamicus sp.]